MKLRAFVLGIPFAFLAAACTYDNGDANRVLYSNQTGADGGPDTSYYSCGTPTQAAIDTDQQIDIDAGLGAGVFIEYATGGHYHVRVSCDTTRSNLACQWQVTVTPGAGQATPDAGQAIMNVVGEGLEGNDSVTSVAPNGYQLNAYTTTEIDGFTFDTAPGAAVTVAASLDGACATPYYFGLVTARCTKGRPRIPSLSRLRPTERALDQSSRCLRLRFLPARRLSLSSARGVAKVSGLDCRPSSASLSRARSRASSMKRAWLRMPWPST